MKTIETIKKEIGFKGRMTAISILMGFFIVVCLLLLEGCSKTSAAPPTSVEKNTQLLTSSTWKIQTVQTDGVDKTAAFAGMSLKFTNTGFTTVSGNVVWPASGTWSFTDATATSFTRDDGAVIAIKSINATSLQVSLTWSKTTLGGGRISSVSGQYVFTFTN